MSTGEVVDFDTAAKRLTDSRKKKTPFELPQERSYVGAGRGKRFKDWNPTGGSANSHLATSSAVLRARAHDLVRNNPHAANIVSRHADHIVGTGFTPKFKTGDDKLDAILKERWTALAEDIDPAGLLTFDGMVYQAARSMVAGGEVYFRRRDRRLGEHVVPMQVQLLEAEIVDWARSLPYAPNSQNIVRQGVEFDAIGHRRGYWMYRENPGSEQRRWAGRESVFVPADEVAHLYEPLRDQVHGETWLAPVMIKLRDLDDYDETEMVRKKTEACLVGVVIPHEDTQDDEDPNIGLPVDKEAEVDPDTGLPVATEAWGMEDANGDPVERMEPGMIYQARPGATVEFNTPATSAGYDTYTRTQLRSIAAGARMPYEVMTGDLSEVSFASGRMGKINYERFIEGVQYNLVIPMLCRPVGRWFIEKLRQLGDIPEGIVVRQEWTAPAFRSITPIDDAAADLSEVRSGFASWDEKVRARGYDPDVVAAEIAKRNAFWDAHGIVLDIDPRLVGKNGQRHPIAAEEGSTDAPGEQEREEAEARRPRPHGAKRRGKD